MQLAARSALLGGILVSVSAVSAQTNYKVVPVPNPGTISGTVQWVGPVPRGLSVPINKDVQICDPDSKKTRDLERLVIGPQGGVANTIVYLQNITEGKPMDLPEPRRFLNQRSCRYEPHILLVPQTAALQMKSSDPVLHTVHMDGAATFNLPFPFPNQVISRNMATAGVVNLKCNGGHTWMNAEMMVAPHPYYAVTDESGKFELSNVPPGTYHIVAWHEGWQMVRSEAAIDVLTERRVQRPVFSPARTWEKDVAVEADGNAAVRFTLSEK